MGKCLPKGCM